MNPLSNDALNFLSLFTKGELDSLDFEDPFTENQTRGCRELIEKGIIVEVNMGFYKQIAEVERAGQSPAWTGLQADLARLTKENEELRKDKEILDWLEERRLTHFSLTDAILIHVSKVETVRAGIRTAIGLARLAEESARDFKAAMQQKGQV